MLSTARARRLKPLLDAFAEARPWTERVKFDPVEFPHRYSDPRDIEVVALLSASLAYGRAELFKPKIAGILEALGPSPAARLMTMDVAALKPVLDGFVYRFNLPADLGVLLLGMGNTTRSSHRATACAAHLRSLSAALALYASDSSEYLPYPAWGNADSGGPDTWAYASLNLEQVSIGYFAQLVFADVLKRNVNVDPIRVAPNAQYLICKSQALIGFCR